MANNNFVDLLKEQRVISPFVEEPSVSSVSTEGTQKLNCSPELVIYVNIFKNNFQKNIYFRVMRCSLNVIPQTKDLLDKTRLPFGVLIHPFKDLEVK